MIPKIKKLCSVLPKRRVPLNNPSPRYLRLAQLKMLCLRWKTYCAHGKT